MKTKIFEPGQIAMCWHLDPYGKNELYFCKILSLNNHYARCLIYEGYSFNPNQSGRVVDDVLIDDLEYFHNDVLFDPEKKYVVLEHLTLPHRGFRFWCLNSEDADTIYNGMVAYRVIKYTDSTDEAIVESRRSTDALIATYDELVEHAVCNGY